MESAAKAAIVGMQPEPLAAKASGSGRHVAILMGTFNGERHLQEQLDSLAAQTHTDWSLWVSDDGSTDRTLDLVQAFARRFSPGKVQCIQGPRLGFAANFMSLLARPDLRGNYFAFCDQDDVWLPHRLAVTLEALASVHPHSPALACGRTEYMDEHGQPMGESRPAPANCSFEVALAQNFCGGNTMLINGPARSLLTAIPVATVSAHDWLAFLLVAGAGGSVLFSDRTLVCYRQHGGNSLGENQSLKARLSRLGELMAGEFKRRTSLNVEALRFALPQLTPHNQSVFECFEQGRTAPAGLRGQHLARSGVRRLGMAENWAYRLAYALGRI